MKASEALLMVIRDQGGQVDVNQFNKWLGQLTEAGFLVLTTKGTGDSFKAFYKITDKGQDLLKARRL